MFFFPAPFNHSFNRNWIADWDLSCFVSHEAFSSLPPLDPPWIMWDFPQLQMCASKYIAKHDYESFIRGNVLILKWNKKFSLSIQSSEHALHITSQRQQNVYQ